MKRHQLSPEQQEAFNQKLAAHRLKQWNRIDRDGSFGCRMGQIFLVIVAFISGMGMTAGESIPAAIVFVGAVQCIVLLSILAALYRRPL